MISVVVLGRYPFIGHQYAQSVKVIDTLFSGVIGPNYHPVAFIKHIGAHHRLLLILVVNLLGVVAPFVIGIISMGLPLVITLGGNLVQIVQLVVYHDIVAVPLIGQIPQAVILVVPCLVAMVFMGLHQPVQFIILICPVFFGLSLAVAPLILTEQIAIGIIAVGVLDGLQIFLAWVDIPDFYHTAHAVIFVFCNPAIGIALFCYTVHPVVVIAGHIAVVALGYGFQVLHQVIGVAHHGIVGIGDGAFIAHRIIGICYGISSVVSHLGQLSQQIYFIGGGSQPVIHLHQLAYLVVGIVYFLDSIIVNIGYQINGTVGIACHIAILVCLLNQVAVAVILVGNLILFGVDYCGDQSAAIIAVQGDFLLIHFVLAVNPVQIYFGQIAYLIVGKFGAGAQCVNGFHNIAVAV